MDDLHAELDLLERRYGPSKARAELTKVQTALARHHFEVDRLNAELDQLLDRRRVALESVERLTNLQSELLRRLIVDERRAHGEAWSPTPILGFRAWVLDGGLLQGAAEPWHTPEKEATCLTVSEVDEVPHTDGRCGVPACGIYALKRASDLRTVTGWERYEIALGLVELTGKVVEHTLGYRAQHVKVLAVAVPRSDGILFASKPADVADVMAGDWERLQAALPTTNVYDTMCFWLEAQKELQQPWISESKSA